MSQLPESAQRYLRHAIAAGTPLASAVRLRTHGEIKLKRWLPFTAEQSITAHGAASGPDITRSAVGRVAAESVWLPSMLSGDGVRWTASDSQHLRVSFSIGDIELTIGNIGAVKAVQLSRWGDFFRVTIDEATYR